MQWVQLHPSILGRTQQLWILRRNLILGLKFIHVVLYSLMWHLLNSTKLLKVVSFVTGIWSDSPTVHYYVTRLANLTLHTALCIESLQDSFLKQVFLLILSLRSATVRPTQAKKVTLWRIRPNFGGLDSPQKTRFMTVSSRLSGPENKFNDQKVIVSFTVLNLFIFSHCNFALFFVFEFSVIYLWSSL